MFFRDKKSPSGQVLQLLEAFRDEENRARNRVVISLGGAPMDAADRPAVVKPGGLLLSPARLTPA